MNNLSKLWHKLWGRSDRDIYFIERVVEIENLVHDLGAWHLLTLNSPSTSMLESKVLVINNNLEHLVWEYNDLLVNDEHSGKSDEEIGKTITGLDGCCLLVENNVEHESDFRKNDPDTITCKIYKRVMKMRGFKVD